MIEKRFEFIGSYLYDGKESIGSINDNNTIIRMEDMMNELDLEIKTLDHLLKIQTDFLKSEGYSLRDIVKFLDKE